MCKKLVANELMESQDWLSVAQLCYQSGALEAALAVLEKGLVTEPYRTDGWILKGTICLRLGKYQRSYEAITWALAIQPDLENDDEVLLKQGLALNNLGRYEEAITVLNIVLTIKPNVHDVLKVKGMALSNLDRYEEAITAFDAALVLKPATDAHCLKGVLLGKLGRYEEAITAFDAALALKPAADAFCNRGVALSNLDRYEEAIAAFDAALALEPNMHNAFFNKGIALNKLNRYEEAITAFNATLALKRDIHDAYLLKGMALHKLNRYEEAITAFDATLALKPNMHDAFFHKGVALGDLGRYEEAITAFDANLALRPDMHDALCNKGVALSNLGRYEDAITAFDAALVLKSDEFRYWFNRAYAICYLSKTKLGNNRPTSINLSSYIRSKTIPSLQASEPHIAALREALPYLAEGSYNWAYIHSDLGDTYLKHSNRVQNPAPYWRDARRSYQTAATVLTAQSHPEDHLKILRGLIRVELNFEDIIAAREYQRQGSVLFNQLRAEKPDALKPAFERQFSDFIHLEIDLLIGENSPTAALEQAEFYKNRCLTWVLDAWQASPATPKYREIQPLLSVDTAILYWHLSQDSLTTFILLADNAEPIVLDTDRKAQSQQFRSWFGRYNGEYRGYANKKRDPKTQEKHPWRTHLQSLLELLQQVLKIDKICQQLPEEVQRLILLPHRQLHCLPLAALFPEVYTCTHLPSLQIGLALSPEPPPIAPLLNIDDPDLDQAAMPFARIESAVIRALVGNATPLEHNVTAAAAKEALSLRYAAFHFTGHGAYDARQPENSALQLSDQPLTVKQIRSLDLSSYGLVCLAACETALNGTEGVPAEYVGLASAFIKAGATKVVSTLWPVDEIASAWIMIRFYQALLMGQSAAVALKTAQYWLRTVTWNELAVWIADLSQLPGLNQGIIDKLRNYPVVMLKDIGTLEREQPTKYRHPYYWAAFILTGRV